MHVVPCGRRGESPAAWVGQRVAYCFLKRSVLNSWRDDRHEAAAVAAALAGASPMNERVPDVRTLTAWANLSKRVQHSVASSVEQVFAASARSDLGLPSGESRFLDALMSSPLDYSHLPTLAGAWSRHVASLDIPARLDQSAERRLATAQRLLTAIARAWSPSNDTGRMRRSQVQRDRFDVEVRHAVAVLYVPEAPWTVLQYMVALAASSDHFDDTMLSTLALDLAAARWSTSALLDEGERDWPGRWHVVEASDTARNLLLESIGGLRQAVTLTERGYPWSNFKAPSRAGANFVRLKRAYRRTLREFGLRTASLEETVLPADLVRLRDEISKWAPIIRSGAASH